MLDGRVLTILAKHVGSQQPPMFARYDPRVLRVRTTSLTNGLLRHIYYMRPISKYVFSYPLEILSIAPTAELSSFTIHLASLFRTSKTLRQMICTRRLTRCHTLSAKGLWLAFGSTFVTAVA